MYAVKLALYSFVIMTALLFAGLFWVIITTILFDMYRKFKKRL